jgi:hypothetical protein
MEETVKSKIYKLIDSINDETTLVQVMEDVTFYASKKDVVDSLTSSQLAELDEAIKEADSGETIRYDDFKKELDEWRKK